ncbi:orotate phosphoribosyltransferase [Streptomyces sp. IMTB 2501]|uniref:orotate phosphoribosyltransferase n=1 Tax=Streptomyces sp. IMTB 2501 TaxID=1776340 RepID=UPI0021167370|nr:phosphoribosyltransferase family protein [Streptomyces sp. IMTB 2501]
MLGTKSKGFAGDPVLPDMLLEHIGVTAVVDVREREHPCGRRPQGCSVFITVSASCSRCRQEQWGLGTWLRAGSRCAGCPGLLEDRTPVTHSDLARRIHAASHLTGHFTLRSGRSATEYFDKYRFEGDPVLLDEIAQRMALLVPSGTEVLAGLEMGGIPVVTALGRHTGLPCAFVRKQAKPYGTCRLAEGADVEGRRVLVVEDVVTSGGQIVLSAADLRGLGAHVHEALCVIDREQGGADALAAEGIRLLSLLMAADLRAAAA